MPRIPHLPGSWGPRAEAGERARPAGQRERISARRALRGARSCTCHGSLSRPARGRRAPRGAVLRAPGLSLPRRHSPDEPTAAATRAKGRSQSRTERAPTQQEAEKDGLQTPLHSAAAGALRWEPPRERETAPAL